MTEQTARSRVLRKQKDRKVPLYKLRTSDAVKIICDSPRRLEELWILLEDRNRRIRDRAAATLAELVSVHPSRLLRSVSRMQVSLLDESAYVRWHIVYTLGFLVARSPSRLQGVLPDLLGCLEDGNRVVRLLASKALAQIGAENPKIIEKAFNNAGKQMPAVVAHTLRLRSKGKTEK
jgi:HEAT repeat protein